MATETRRHRDRTRRQGDKGIRGQGEKRLVSLSPLLLVSPSILISASLLLCGIDPAGMMTNRIDGGMMRSQIYTFGENL